MLTQTHVFVFFFSSPPSPGFRAGSNTLVYVRRAWKHSGVCSLSGIRVQWAWRCFPLSFVPILSWVLISSLAVANIQFFCNKKKKKKKGITFSFFAKVRFRQDLLGVSIHRWGRPLSSGEEGASKKAHPSSVFMSFPFVFSLHLGFLCQLWKGADVCSEAPLCGCYISVYLSVLLLSLWGKRIPLEVTGNAAECTWFHQAFSPPTNHV